MCARACVCFLMIVVILDRSTQQYEDEANRCLLTEEKLIQTSSQCARTQCWTDKPRWYYQVIQCRVFPFRWQSLNKHVQNVMHIRTTIPIKPEMLYLHHAHCCDSEMHCTCSLRADATATVYASSMLAIVKIETIADAKRRTREFNGERNWR